MTTVKLFKAGADTFYTGSDLYEVVEEAKADGWEVEYDDVEIARDDFGLADGKIYYSVE